jgi:hypothetical protein
MFSNYANIANGIDERISILKHIDSGYYNVSQSLKAIGEVCPEDLQGSNKTWSDWFRTTSAKAVVTACETEMCFKKDESYFSISSGTFQFRGTYVHRFLYDHILSWASPTYAMKVSRILDEYHDRMRARLERENGEKDDRIGELNRKMDEQERKADERERRADEQFQKLLAFSERAVGEREEMREELHQRHNEVSDTKKIVQEVEQQLEEKSFVSTMNPDSKDLHHHALVLEKNCTTSHEIRIVVGQSAYVDTRRNLWLDRGYEVMTAKFYQANRVDYRRNV